MPCDLGTPCTYTQFANGPDNCRVGHLYQF
jgi:hypothetical protein